MKKIKDSIAGVLYRILILIAKLLPAPKGEKHLLIIKLDEIGDYMLFRNLLKYFKQSEKYSGYRITFLGNAAWKPIFDEYDVNTVDSSIWVTKKRFNKDLWYRFSLYRQIRYLRTSDVIDCVYSRSMIVDDGFAFVAKGDRKTAMKADKFNSNVGRHSINLDKYIYTTVVDAGDEKIFDSIRDSNFVSKLLNKKLPVTIDVAVTNANGYSFSKHFAIFIGPGNRLERRWPVDNFVRCAEYIQSKYGLMPIVCGGPPDTTAADLFLQLYKREAINMAGKTTLPGFVELMSKMKFLLSVDNGPVHMAAAANCPVIGLYSGVHYGRYAPYPKEVAYPFFSVYPDYVEKLVEERNNIVYDPFIMKNEAIRTIPVDKVKPYIDKIMELVNSFERS